MHIQIIFATLCLLAITDKCRGALSHAVMLVEYKKALSHAAMPVEYKKQYFTDQHRFLVKANSSALLTPNTTNFSLLFPLKILAITTLATVGDGKFGVLPTVGP